MLQQKAVSSLWVHIISPTLHCSDLSGSSAGGGVCIRLSTENIFHECRLSLLLLVVTSENVQYEENWHSRVVSGFLDWLQ